MKLNLDFEAEKSLNILCRKYDMKPELIIQKIIKDEAVRVKHFNHINELYTDKKNSDIEDLIVELLRIGNSNKRTTFVVNGIKRIGYYYELENKKAFTVNDFIDIDLNTVLRYSGFGKKTIVYLKEAMDNLNIKWVKYDEYMALNKKNSKIPDDYANRCNYKIEKIIEFIKTQLD